MYQSEQALMGITGIAIALIGFSGVITTLGRRGKSNWTAQEVLQLRTLIEPSIVVMFGAFIPLIVGFFTQNQEILWRVSNGILLSVNLVIHILFWIRRSITEVHLSQKFMTVLSVLIYLILISSIFNLSIYHELAFILCLLMNIGVSVNNFYLLLFDTGDNTA